MGLVRILLAPARALRAAIITMVVFMAFVTAVIVFFAALVAVVVVAYLKREEWTLPAYRWARDRSGQWTFTPWSSAQDAVQQAEEATTAP